MKKSKVFKTALAAGIASAAVVVPVQTEASTISFTDVTAENMHYNDIIELATAGVVVGYGDGTYKPKQDVRRDHAVRIIAQLVGFDASAPVTNPNFSDVPTTHPQYKEIAFLVSKGVLSGDGDGKFSPERTLSRGEMALILSRAFEFTATPGATTPFTDINDSIYKNYITALFDTGVTAGTTTTTYSPKANVTREQLATFVVKASKVLPADFEAVKDTFLPSVLGEIEIQDVPGVVTVATSAADKTVDVNVADVTVITKDQLVTQADDLIDQLIGNGATKVLKNVVFNGVTYDTTTDLATVDYETVATNFGKALGLTDAEVASLLAAAGNDAVFALLTGSEYTGTVTLNYKDGSQDVVTITLTLAN